MSSWGRYQGISESEDRTRGNCVMSAPYETTPGRLVIQVNKQRGGTSEWSTGQVEVDTVIEALLDHPQAAAKVLSAVAERLGALVARAWEAA